jgi:hypothetical protein
MAHRAIIKFIVVLMVTFGLPLVSLASKTAATGDISHTHNMVGRHMTIALAPAVINRIHGPEPIKKINAPQSLALDVEYQGNDAFIILGKKAKPGVIYIITRTDEVFSIEILPDKGVKARLINLDFSKSQSRANRIKFAKLDQETAAVDLIRNAFADTIPDSFNVTPKNSEIKAIKHLKILQRRTVSIDGVPLELNEYLVRIAPLSGISEMAVEERTFLVPKLTRNPTAIALGRDLARYVNGKVVLRRGQYLRLFIVEQQQN